MNPSWIHNGERSPKREEETWPSCPRFLSDLSSLLFQASFFLSFYSIILYSPFLPISTSLIYPFILYSPFFSKYPPSFYYLNPFTCTFVLHTHTHTGRQATPASLSSKGNLSLSFFAPPPLCPSPPALPTHTNSSNWANTLWRWITSCMSYVLR